MLNVNLLCFFFFLLFLIWGGCYIIVALDIYNGSWAVWTASSVHMGNWAHTGEHTSKDEKRSFSSLLLFRHLFFYIGRDIDKKRVGHRFDLTNHIKACRCKAFISFYSSLYLARSLSYIYL